MFFLVPKESLLLVMKMHPFVAAGSLQLIKKLATVLEKLRSI